MALLELRDVHVRYGAVEALRGVTLTVEDRDFVAILGASGAGKTTTLRAASGLVHATGEIRLEGDDVTRLDALELLRRGVAHVPEGRGTFAALSVLDNLRLGAWARPGSRDRELVHVFERFPQLYDRRRRKAGALSAAEQQVLALGRALMSKPRLLLVDEPSSGLPLIVVRELYRTLQQINEDGTAVVVVEQRALLALARARHAFVVDAGRIVLGGPAEDVRADESLRRSQFGS